MTARQRRWRGAVAATIAVAIAGLAVQNGVLLLAAAIPLAYVGYGSLSRVRVPEALSATRRVEPTPAAPGRPVTVTLTVTNDADRTLPDVRVADGVPDDIAVLEGSPRGGTTLEPGDDLEVSYAVVARRGEYDFERPQCRVRGLGAGAVATRRLSVAGETTLVCRLDADAPPIAERGGGRVGGRTTDRPGEGVTFHSIREHRPEDPADRIDWRHYAKRGSLATVTYDRRVAATVVLALDARDANRVVAGRGRPTAVERSAYAATRALTDLLRTGHEVGVAVLGLDGPGPEGLYWLSPASGRDQRSRALDLFRTATDADESGPGRTRAAGPTEQARKLIELAPPGAQVALFSPLLDDPPVEAVETWRAAGLPVVALAPDVVPANTVSGQYEQVRRRTRLARCQSAGARAVDWRRGTPLPLAIERAFAADARLPADRSANGGADRRRPTAFDPGGDPFVDAGGDD